MANKTILLSLAVVVSLIILTPVHAAPVAPGSVPEKRPLQPIPEGTVTDYKEDINSEEFEKQKLEQAVPQNPDEKAPGSAEVTDTAFAAPPSRG